MSAFLRSQELIDKLNASFGGRADFRDVCRNRRSG